MTDTNSVPSVLSDERIANALRGLEAVAGHNRAMYQEHDCSPFEAKGYLDHAEILDEAAKCFRELQSRRSDPVRAELLEALKNYLWAEEMDDPAIRDGELAVARQEARAAITRAEAKP